MPVLPCIPPSLRQPTVASPVSPLKPSRLQRLHRINLNHDHPLHFTSVCRRPLLRAPVFRDIALSGGFESIRKLVRRPHLLLRVRQKIFGSAQEPCPKAGLPGVRRASANLGFGHAKPCDALSRLREWGCSARFHHLLQIISACPRGALCSVGDAPRHLCATVRWIMG